MIKWNTFEYDWGEGVRARRDNHWAFSMPLYDIWYFPCHHVDSDQAKSEETVYTNGRKDICTVFFYSLAWIVIHAIIQEYILDVSKMQLEKLMAYGWIIHSFEFNYFEWETLVIWIAAKVLGKWMLTFIYNYNYLNCLLILLRKSIVNFTYQRPKSADSIILEATYRFILPQQLGVQISFWR